MSDTVEAENARILNILEMSFLFTSMARVFQKHSKTIILAEYKKTLAIINNISSKEEFETEHTNFCNWFCMNIKRSKLKNGIFNKYASYGQAAKVLDIMLKVEFYYCNKDKEIVKFLHAAIDTPILKYLKGKYKEFEISAKTIYDIGQQEYYILQKVIKKDISIDYKDKILPVQYDDIKWRALNKD